jgi:lipopolysaccharide core galacturonosyltransferase RgtB
MASMTSGKRASLALAVYLVLHALIRLWVADSAELDEAEQVVLAQELRWGYAGHPPLYTWLQKGVFSVFGLSLFSLVLLKGLLLFALGALVYATAREVTRQRDSALLAMASLALIPQFIWESQRDLTHSVLATAATAASLLAFLKVAATRRPEWWLAFGASAGLAVLGKYNAGLFLAALLSAAWSLPAFQPLLRSAPALLGLAAFTLITGPHLAWMTTVPEAVLTQSGPLFPRDAGHLLQSWGLGLWNLLEALLSFLGLLLLVFGLARWRATPTGTVEAQPDGVQLLGRTLLLAVGLSIAAVLVFQTQMKARWLQPVLFLTPIWVAAQASGWLSPGRRNALVTLGAAAALAAMAGTVLQPMAAACRGKTTRMTAPMGALAGELEPHARGAGVILADSRWVGGNLRLHLPGHAVLVPEFPSLAVPTNGPWLAVWDATRRAEPPKALLKLAQQKHGTDLSRLAPQYVEAPFRYLPGHHMKLGWIALPAR